MISLSRLKEMVEEEMENKIKELEEKLLRKEQECEKLKSHINCICFDPSSNNNRCISYNRMAEDYESDLKQLDQLKAENAILKQYKASKQASYESMQREWNDAVNENRELKAENEELKDKNERLTILGMDLNQSNEVLRKSFFATDKSRDNWREKAEKLERTVAEIKEIAEKLTDDYGHKVSNANRILQKISECEVLDEQTNS